MEAARERTEITLEPEVLERYVGRYQLAPNFVLTISREQDQLFTQATGQGRAPIFPESETEFFLRVVEAQLTFEVDANHRATGLVLHQGGQTIPAKRIEDYAQAALIDVRRLERCRLRSAGLSPSKGLRCLDGWRRLNRHWN